MIERGNRAWTDDGHKMLLAGATKAGGGAFERQDGSLAWWVDWWATSAC